MSQLTQNFLELAFKNEEEEKRAAAIIAKDMTNGIYGVSDLVTALGFAFTSSVVDLRVSATNLLSLTLHEIPSDLLNANELELLSTFYADRLKDHHSVIPAIIDGIDALIKMQNFIGQNIVKFLQSFFQNTTCQTQVRSDRAKLYRIFKYIIVAYKEELIAMSGDFIYGLINSIDGERDPRNLDFIFTFMPNFIENYPLLHLSEEMFEIFACYFPIDFNPNKNDLDVITRENLAQKLGNCLTATPEFVEWCVPLALEKLESDLLIAKFDALELLEKSALKFPPKVLEPHFAQIWLAIKNEILPGTDNKVVVQMGLKTLGSILERAGDITDISKNYQTIILGYILPQLSDVNQRLFNPSTAIALVCIIGDAKFAGEKILTTFLLKLQVTTNYEALSDDERVKIYNILSQIFRIAKMRNTIKELSGDGDVCTKLHAELINSLRLNDNNDVINNSNLEIKTAALSVLYESVQLINEGNRTLLYKILVQLINHEKIDLEFKKLLFELGELYPIELQSNCVDICMRNFPIFSNFIKRKIFKNLLTLVKLPHFEKSVLNMIFQCIFHSDGVLTTTEDVRLLGLEALNTSLVQDYSCTIKYIINGNIIDELIKLAQKNPTIKMDELEQIAVALNNIIQKLDETQQEIIVIKYLKNLNLQLAADLFIAKGLLGFLSKNVSLDGHFERLLNDLTSLSLQSDDENLRKVAHHLLCSLVNKMNYHSESSVALRKIIKNLEAEIKKEQKKAVETLAWIGKGLMMLGCDEAGEIMEMLAKLLDHPSLASAATLAFEILSAECPQLHLPVVKYLFKQKFFHIVLKTLGDKLIAYSEQHLNAFIYVLQATPHVILKMNIEKIGPIIFKSLESTQVHTLCIALVICENFIKQQDEYFRSHLQHIIPSCLKLATYKSSMQVRINALNLLYDITKYPTFVLLPHKVDVVLELSKALDDQKRLVRNAAVTARNSWYLVGAPNTE